MERKKYHTIFSKEKEIFYSIYIVRICPITYVPLFHPKTVERFEHKDLDEVKKKDVVHIKQKRENGRNRDKDRLKKDVL